MASLKDKDHPDIFILDDDALVRELLRVILERGGYKPICFADECALLEAMRGNTPVCVFLDNMLPSRSGLEILKEITEYSVPVIMISGYGDISIAVNAIKSGAYDFLEKPFTSEDVISRLQNVLENCSPQYNEAKMPPSHFPGRELLTRREHEVIKNIAMGLTSKEASVALGISHRTIDDHIANVMRKLGVRSRYELLIAIMKKRP